MFKSVLEQLQPVCVAEQKFLTSFFHFQKPLPNEQVPSSQVKWPCQTLPLVTLSVSLQEEVDDVDIPFRKGQPQVLQDIHSVGGGLQGLLAQLFQTLLPEVEGLIQFAERLDS